MTDTQIEEAMAIACDQLCKRPDQCETEDELYDYCCECPLTEKLESFKGKRHVT